MGLMRSTGIYESKGAEQALAAEASFTDIHHGQQHHSKRRRGKQSNRGKKANSKQQTSQLEAKEPMKLKTSQSGPAGCAI